MSSEISVEIEDKPTAVRIMRELVEHLQDTIERSNARSPAIASATNTGKLSRARRHASPSPSRS
jgi:hypothetical protein